MARGWLPAWLLCAVAFGGASLIVPLYLVELGGGAFDLGVLFATSSFVGVPAALIFGGLADRTGKRRIFVLVAMAITVGTMLAIPTLESQWAVIMVHALLWLGFAAAIPILTLLVVAGEPEHVWSSRIGRLNRFQGYGWSLGLLVGFLVTSIGAAFFELITAQRMFFVICAGSAALGFLLAARGLPPDHRPDDEPTPQELRRLSRRVPTVNLRAAAFPFSPSRYDPRNLKLRRFIDRFTPQLGLFFAAVLCAFIGFGVFFAPLPAYLSDIGYESGTIFGLYLILNLGAALVYDRVPALAARFATIPVHISALIVRGGTLPGIAIIGIVAGGAAIEIGLTSVTFVVLGLTWAAIAVTAATLVTTLSPALIRGESLGVYGALVALGGGIGGLIGGWLATFGYLVAFGVAGGLVFVAAGGVRILHGRIEDAWWETSRL